MVFPMGIASIYYPVFSWCSTLMLPRPEKIHGVVPWIESDRDRKFVHEPAESDMTVMLAFRGVELPSQRGWNFQDWELPLNP